MQHCMGLAPSQGVAEILVEGLQKELGFPQASIKCLFTDSRWKGRLGFRPAKNELGQDILEVCRFEDRALSNPIVVSVVTDTLGIVRSYNLYESVSVGLGVTAVTVRAP